MRSHGWVTSPGPSSSAQVRSPTVTLRTSSPSVMSKPSAPARLKAALLGRPGTLGIAQDAGDGLLASECELLGLEVLSEVRVTVEHRDS